jgi:hypothetical protein
MKKIVFVSGLLLSGLSFGVPYEYTNPLDPAWHSLTHQDQSQMCRVNVSEPLVYDSTALGVCDDSEFIQAEEEEKSTFDDSLEDRSDIKDD